MPSRRLKGWSGWDHGGGFEWKPVVTAVLEQGTLTAEWGDEDDTGNLLVHAPDDENFRGRWERGNDSGIAEFALYRNTQGLAFLGRWIDPAGQGGRWFLILDWD